jgi:hypothetical protein
MRTIQVFSQIAELIVAAWSMVRKFLFSQAAKKAEETKDTKALEDLINK